MGELAHKAAMTQAPPQAPQKTTREQDEDDEEDEEEDDHEAAIDGRGRQVMGVEGAEAPGSSGRGRKRQRKTAEQVSVLEAHFSANPLPDKALRDRLGVQLGLTTRQVQIWFQNKVPHPRPPPIEPPWLPRASFGPMRSGPRPSRISSNHCSHRSSRRVLPPSSPRYAPPRVFAPVCPFYSAPLTLRPPRGPSCRRAPCRWSPGQLRGLASLPPASGSVQISPPPL